MALNVLLQAAKFVQKEGDDPEEVSRKSKSVKVVGVYAEEQGDEAKKGRPFGHGSREQHNKLEKNRRAEMRQFFLKLKKNVPSLEGKVKASNASILAEATDYIKELEKTEKAFKVERYRLDRCRLCLEEQVRMLKEEIRRQDMQRQLFAQVQQEKLRRQGKSSTHTQASQKDILDTIAAAENDNRLFGVMKVNDTVPLDTDSPKFVNMDDDQDLIFSEYSPLKGQIEMLVDTSRKRTASEALFSGRDDITESESEEDADPLQIIEQEIAA